MANMKKLTRDYGEVIWTGKKCILGMPISFTRYILTDSKLITRVGLLNLREDEIELYRVYDKSMKLPLGHKLFRLVRIRYLDGIPVMISTAFLDAERFPGLKGQRHPHKGAAVSQAPARGQEAA